MRVGQAGAWHTPQSTLVPATQTDLESGHLQQVFCARAEAAPQRVRATSRSNQVCPNGAHAQRSGCVLDTSESDATGYYTAADPVPSGCIDSTPPWFARRRPHAPASILVATVSRHPSPMPSTAARTLRADDLRECARP